MKIERGHLYTANLNPRFGTEAGKVRPVLVVQTDLINGEHPSTLVCPLTTKIQPDVEILRVHLKEGEAGLEQDSDVLMDQVRAIDNKRLKEEIGRLTKHRLAEVQEKLSIVFDIMTVQP